MQKAYRELLTSSREGFNLTESEFSRINDIVKDGLKRGLSPYNICEANKNSLVCSARTVYRLNFQGSFTTYVVGKLRL